MQNRISFSLRDKIVQPYLEPEDSLMYRSGGVPYWHHAMPLLMHYDLTKVRQEQIDLCRDKAVPDIATVNIDVVDSSITLHVRDVSHTFIEQLATLGELPSVDVKLLSNNSSILFAECPFILLRVSLM